MFDQKTMNGQNTNGRGGNSPAQNMGSSLADFSHDLISLAELQAQLAAKDFHEGSSRCVLPLGLIAAALVLALGAVPVLLMGLSWVLVQYAEFSQSLALLVTGLVAIVIAVVLAAVGWIRVRKAMSVFTRSRAELSENIYWIKQALKRRSTRQASRFR